MSTTRPRADTPVSPAGSILPSLFRLSTRGVSVLFWAMTALYAIVFSLISLRLYDAYLPHALDLGNMAQAAWNTAHGYLFRYQNQRLPINFEAFGTSTRLSAHVEPIFPLISVVYFFWQHVQTLLVLQTVALASGAIPARLLARRRLGRGLPELVFPLAYLLFPAMEAANLDEFHPVVFAAPLLLWAFYLADCRRYTLFVLAALGAMACKEEIGIMVGLIGLWIWLRDGERDFGVIVCVLGVAWSLIALKIVVPHFNRAESSYWARYLPVGYPVARYPVTQNDIISFWLHHPGQVWSDLTSEAKLSYLHRILYPTGYLSLLSPQTLVVGLLNLGLVLFSYEPHMYGGLAHYSVELVPVVVAASIFGVEWLGRTVAPRLRIRPAAVVAACCCYLLFASLANQRANGFSPLAESFSYPTITAHDKLLDSVIASIPPNASVSAQDALNAHVSDRQYVFLYPDLDKNRVQYILLDATQGTGSPIHPCDLYDLVVGNPYPMRGDIFPCDVAVGNSYAPSGIPPTAADRQRISAQALLHNGLWNIQFAQDGILLLKRRAPGEPLRTVLPPQFYSFITPAVSTPPHPLVARFGDAFELEGYQIERREMSNLRNPDVVITTWWRVLRTPPAQTVTLMHYLTDPTGAIQNFGSDQPATNWLPPNLWQPGHTYMVTSSQMTVKTSTSGQISILLGMSTNPVQYQDLSRDLPAQIVQSAAGAQLVGPCACKVLRIAQIHAQL